MLERMQRKGNPNTLLVGMQTGAATVENSFVFLMPKSQELPNTLGRGQYWMLRKEVVVAQRTVFAHQLDPTRNPDP